MPLGDRIKARFRDRREVRDGDEYDDTAEAVELMAPDPDHDPPPEDVRGEPWGWPEDKPRRPRGWPGPDHRRDEPGPFDGRWERDGTD